MPPRASLTSFSVSDPDNEVVCPLTNQDGSQCRKRCFGEKRYRSMQEHIRRAHPEHYIPKLPATEESFQFMINKVPSPPTTQYPQDSSLQQHSHSTSDPNVFHGQDYGPRPPANLRRGSMLQSANAAAALAQLHNSRPESDWQADQDAYGDTDNENTYLHNYFAGDAAHDMFNDTNPLPDRDFMGPPLNRTPSARASSLQPLSRLKPNRPRKSSVTDSARKPKHERDRSKELKRVSHDRKAFSAEPSAFGNKRWEDLLDAAASATEEDSRDLTPIPQSPRSSIPPGQSHSQGQNQFQSFTTSPLQNAVLTQSPVGEDNGDVGPAPFNQPHMEPFPSVESYDHATQSQPYHHHQSSNESANSHIYTPYQTATQQHRHHPSQSSGTNFHIPHDGLSSSSPQEQHHRTTSFSRSTHYPHALHQAAAQAAAAHQQHHQQLQQQQQQQQQQHHQPQTPHTPQHPYSAHHASYSASQAAAAHAPSLHSQHSGMSSHTHLQDEAPQTVQHYCAACHRITALNSSYACTECICGICRDCVDVLVSMDPARGAGCPRCQVVGGRFKPFMLDLR